MASVWPKLPELSDEESLQAHRKERPGVPLLGSLLSFGLRSALNPFLLSPE